MSYYRPATHAGSWYSGKAEKLMMELGDWMKKAQSSMPESSNGSVVALIGPHAGYTYCGPTSAFAYSKVDATRIKKVFILGPSHHRYYEGVALSTAKVYETPIGDLPVDTDIIKQLDKKLGPLSEFMDPDTDEEEHSLEMHLPFVSYVMKESSSFSVIPMLVGQMSTSKEKQVGKILADYFNRDDTLFVISSDFCHWGARFQYTYYDEADGPIYKSIEKLDRMGMNAIESKSPETFSTYMKRYKNTICGNHPISVLLQAMQGSQHTHDIRFLSYAQSSQCTSMRESSVSYAAGVVLRRG